MYACKRWDSLQAKMMGDDEDGDVEEKKDIESGIRELTD
jgi:hypothetical protein